MTHVTKEHGSAHVSLLPALVSVSHPRPVQATNGLKVESFQLLLRVVDLALNQSQTLETNI